MDANIKTLQDALEWLECRIHEEAEADGEMTNEHAIQLGFIQNMLAKFPRRNCDVGTAEEQAERLHRFCISQDYETCPCNIGKADGRCEFAWMQMPYEEGGAK